MVVSANTELASDAKLRGRGKPAEAASFFAWRKAGWRWRRRQERSAGGWRQVTVVVSAHTELASDAKPCPPQSEGRKEAAVGRAGLRRQAG